MLADGEVLFDGPPGELLRAARASDGGDLEPALVRVPAPRAGVTEPVRAMSWLLRKDLLILRRSRLLVALLVDLSGRDRAADRAGDLARRRARPKVAIVDETPPGQTVQVGSRARAGRAATRKQLFDQVQSVKVATRAQAVHKVKSGKVLAAVVIPANIAARLGTGLKQAQLEVLYNGNALEQSLVQSQIDAALAQANIALLRTDPARRVAGDRRAAERAQPRRARRPAT